MVSVGVMVGAKHVARESERAAPWPEAMAAVPSEAKTFAVGIVGKVAYVDLY